MIFIESSLIRNEVVHCKKENGFYVLYAIIKPD